MGKIKKITRINKGAKANRWAKHKSGLSNPGVYKHRELVKHGQHHVKNSSLTMGAIASHDNILAPFNSLPLKTGELSIARSAYTMLSRRTGTAQTEIDVAYAKPDQAYLVKTNLAKDMEDLDIAEADELKSQAKTFASCYSVKSIPAFDKLFENMVMDKDDKRKYAIISFHNSADKLLKKMDLPQKEISYVVALMTQIQSVMDLPMEVSVGLELLARVMRYAPLPHLRAKCLPYGKLLDAVINRHPDAKDQRLVYNALGCMSILLRAQPASLWTQDNTLNTWLKNILVFTRDVKKKVRKAAQYNVSAVLKGSCFMTTCIKSQRYAKTDDPPTENDDNTENDDPMDNEDSTENDDDAVETDDAMKTDDSAGNDESLEENDPTANEEKLDIHPAVDFVAGFLISQLKADQSSKAAQRSVVHMLVFARQIIMAFPEERLKVVVEGGLYRLVSLGGGLTNCLVLNCLAALAGAKPPRQVLGDALLQSIYATLTRTTDGALNAIKAAPHDKEAVENWAQAVTSLVACALGRSMEEGLVMLENWCAVVEPYLATDDQAIHAMIEKSVGELLDLVTDLIRKQETENIAELNGTENVGDLLTNVVNQLHQRLSFQCQDAWLVVLRLLGQCFQELGPRYPAAFGDALRKVCSELARPDTKWEKALSQCVGRSVQGLGVEAVLAVVPLQLTGDITKDAPHLWILQVLRRYVKGARLSLFFTTFLPLANKCTELLQVFARKEDVDQHTVRHYEMVEHQLWELLATFAQEAVDVEAVQTNKKWAKCIRDQLDVHLVKNALKKKGATDYTAALPRSELVVPRLSAIRALKFMIRADASSQTTGETKLVRNSRNYVNALCNIYTSDEPHVQENTKSEALTTIKEFLGIMPAEKRNFQSKTFMDRFNAKTVAERVKLNMPLWEEPKNKDKDLGRELFKTIKDSDNKGEQALGRKLLSALEDPTNQNEKDLEKKLLKNLQDSENKKEQELGQRLLKKLEESISKKEDMRMKASLLNLVRLTIPFVEKRDELEDISAVVREGFMSRENHLCQKSAYRMLNDLLKCESENLVRLVEQYMSNICDLVFGKAMERVAESSRAERLACIDAILKHLPKVHGLEKKQNILGMIVAECVLCVGRAHTSEVREAASYILTSLPVVLQNLDPSLDSDSVLCSAMRLIAKGITSLHPTTQANSIDAITIFTYKMNDMPFFLVETNVNNVVLKMKSNNSEVVHSCLSFMKSISCFHSSTLAPLLQTIIDGILAINETLSSKFRLKTNAIFTRLIKKFGGEEITNLIPERKIILRKRLRNLRKTVSKEKRLKEQRANKEDESDDSDGEEFNDKNPPTSLEEILAELAPDDELDDKPRAKKDAKKGRKKAGSAWLKEGSSGEEEEEVLDLLSAGASSAIRGKKPAVPRDRPLREKGEEEGGFSVDRETGKILITEETREERKQGNKYSKDAGDDEVEEALKMQSQATTGKISKRKLTEMSEDEISDITATTSGRGKKAPQTKKQRRFDYGKEFRSAKGKGDSQKKGQAQKPYAYVPLGKNRLNKRKQNEFKGQFKGLIRGSRKARKSGKGSAKITFKDGEQI